MGVVSLLISADAHLGRVDISSLSDQILMEMLFSGSTEKKHNRLLDKDGVFLDVCEWPGVTCNTDEQVVNVCKNGFRILEGSVELAYIPPNVTIFTMYYLRLSGTLDTSALPQNMEIFSIRNNDFHGTVEMTQLPAMMKQFVIRSNKFTGSINLEALPNALTHLFLDENKFAGKVSLHCLPPKLEHLDISHNALSGDFYLDNVPEPLEYLYAASNAFNAVATAPLGYTNITLRKSTVSDVADNSGSEIVEDRKTVSVSL